MEAYKRRILCVDDHEDTLFMLGVMLPDYEVVAVDSFNEAVQLIREEGFELYILDNVLGADSGIQLCQYIQIVDPNTPVIFCSSAVYKRDIEEALKAGARVYMRKPVEASILQNTVAQQIQVADVHSLQARVHELIAVQEQIGETLSEVERNLEQMKKSVAKVQAFHAFIAAGGNRAGFERLWQGVWDEATQNSL